MKTIELYKALNIPDTEYQEIKKLLDREPNDLETYLFSAMWSEHCSYKHSKKYLSEIPRAGSVCSDENAGGIQIGDHIIVFKVESHNHPSAIEPFQGAATGIGGIIRDILAVGARPIALLDSLKFGKLENYNSKHLFDGVVQGISTYGNSIGVPTISGEVGFDTVYTSSPLVNVMAVGIVHKDKIRTARAFPDKLVLLVGSHTGRDGIHGASFASKELSVNSKKDRPSVQVGDPFMKKVLIEATLEILELPEVVSCQDLGAAGLLSSSSEMTYKGNCGMELYLDQVHLREEHMQPWEIMLSESQERMLFLIEPSGIDKVLDITKKYDIPASIIGKTTQPEEYKLYWNEKEVANLSAKFLCEGPEYSLNKKEPAYIKEYQQAKLDKQTSTSIPEKIRLLISDPNFASKNWVFRQYDHTVGNRTVIKPGTSGAAGIWIYESDDKIIGLTIDSNGRQVFLDPYNGSKNTIWEAFRNLISSGFDPMGITNCLNYGNPEKDEVAYQFINSIEGIKDACNEINIPVVSGNVSFYNESSDYRVFPTPTIGMIGCTDSIDKIIKNAFSEGERVFLLGKEINDLSDVGGSLYQRIFYDFLGGKVDKIDSKIEIKLRDIIFELRDKNLLGGCVDVSEGGLFGALFEGLRSGNIGFKGNIISCNDEEKSLFGEITGRYLISLRNSKDKNSDAIIKVLQEKQIPFKELGICTGNLLEFDGYKFNIQELFDQYDNSIRIEMEK